LQELNQHLKRFQSKLDGASADPQFEPRFVELPPGKSPQVPGSLCKSRR
jgi:hypothetical protein